MSFLFVYYKISYFWCRFETQNSGNGNNCNFKAMAINKLEQMFDLLKTRSKKRIVAAFANDSHTIGAVSLAVDKGLVDGTLVGDKDTIMKVCAEEGIDASKFIIVHEPNEVKAARKAVEMINAGEGDILMKGLVSTDNYMRAILNKENGLLPPKGVLSHVAVMEIPAYHKLLIVGDVAVIPYPDLKQKTVIANNLINVAKLLGIERPKVAAITASEKVLSSMPACMEASILAKMSERGQLNGGIVDGPISLDVAIDKEVAQVKKVGGEVAGDADCLLFPNIETGNVFYKTSTKFCGAELGAIVCGTKAPAVLSSRGDTVLSKLYSISLAALVAK